MRFGRTIGGPDHLTLQANRLYLFDVGGQLATDLIVGSVIVHLDGNGTGSGEQAVRPAVMEAGNAGTLAIGDEALVQDGQAGGWTHLTFDEPPRLRAGHEVLLGVLAGSADSLARMTVALGNAGVSLRYAVTYAPTATIAGSGTDMSALGSIVAVGVAPWAAPNVTDDELAALPVRVAQDALAGASASVVEDAACAWHYSNESPPPPASAIVRTGGPLEDLVGQRVRLTASTPVGPASVVVVVTDEQDLDLDEDISLARDAFLRIGPLWATTLATRVEVLA